MKISKLAMGAFCLIVASSQIASAEGVSVSEFASQGVTVSGVPDQAEGKSAAGNENSTQRQTEIAADLTAGD